MGEKKGVEVARSGFERTGVEINLWRVFLNFSSSLHPSSFFARVENEGEGRSICQNFRE